MYKDHTLKGKVMIIAGSDSGGGAGIQGDIKACMAMGVYASTVITAITAQNTLGVEGIFEVPTKHIEKQIHAVLRDIGADVIKTGMLSSSTIVHSVVDTIYSQSYSDAPKKLVVDPVMVAKGGARLLEQRAVDKVIELLLPKAYLVTPNIPEAELLSGIHIQNTADMVLAAKKLIEYGAENVLVKGGHLENTEELENILVDGEGNISRFQSQKIHTDNTHGTGCSMASAIASLLAREVSLSEAISLATRYIHYAIDLASGSIGHGHGPINHGFHFDDIIPVLEKK